MELLGRPTCGCDKERFQRLMHQMQDYYGHVEPGYTGHWWGAFPIGAAWLPFSMVGIDLPGAGHNTFFPYRASPDNGPTTAIQWKKANGKTDFWSKEWGKACKRISFDIWVKK